MIVKALLAWWGLRASPLLSADFNPVLHSDAVHDALNVKAAVMAGHARIVRLSAVADFAAAAGDRHLGTSVAEKQTEIRAGLDELARRLD